MKVHLQKSIKRVLIVYGHKTAWNRRVARFLRKQDISYRMMHRDQLGRKKITDTDLVIVLGGDGTFLRTSHHVVDDTPMLGINTRPKKKEGFYMQDLSKTFEKRLYSFLCCGVGKLWKLNRLEAWINKRKLPVRALNEFYIGTEAAYHLARYYLCIDKKQEFQRSSGVLVSTATGSHAWVKSAGGKVLPPCSTKFQVLVREPYSYRLVKNTFMRSIVLNASSTVQIKPSRQPLIIIADSRPQAYKISTSDVVSVKTSDKQLHRLMI